jgi:D-3-phosphoglycerate dehydrogenase
MRRSILVTPRSLTREGLGSIRELDPLRDAGYELVASPPGATPTEDDLARLLPGCVGWLAGVEPITASVLAHADALRVISRNGTGTDAIDLDAAAAAGVTVERAPGANAQGVAELALTLALAALRGVPASARALAEGRWERSLGRELPDSTVGVVGLGAVGSRVAAMFTALGSSVVGFDPYVEHSPTPLVELDDLVRRSTIVSLHSSPPEDGRALVDRDLLALVRPGTVLVNTARSALVDDDAVLEALDDGRLSAYAVDAFDTEPPEPSPLLRHPAVIATPHLGGYTTGSVSRATASAVANLLAALPGGTIR